MKRFRKVMIGLLIAGMLAFLIIPIVIPESTSGTLTNVEAAGPGAEFVALNNLNVQVVHEEYSGECQCQAPLLILMHGFGASTFSWREVVKPLAKLGDVIAYDRPAFGFTERPNTWQGTNPYGFEGNLNLLTSLLEKYGTNRDVVLVGHSAGGQLAAEYARLNPKRIKALILVDPAILNTGGGPEGLDWLYQIPQIARLGPKLVSSIASSGDGLLRKSFYDPGKLTAEVFDGYHQPLKVRGWEKAFWNFATAPRKNQLKENISQLITPTLLITGSADTVVPTNDTIRLSGIMSKSELVVIRQAGHLPHEEQPEAFLSAVSDHLRWLLE